ncbi:YSIRK-type signal peptide-containing protein [Staphylococcus aureus]|nr:YSIRK-type signal peptide-containing protein [Staphylococcus aureus]
MNKNSKKKLDFLPNKLNKYSIRRFTVGTASILVGATLIFGVANDQAEAAENNTTQKQDDSSDASKVKGNVQTIEQSSANSNESDIPEQVDVTKDTTEQASTEEKANTTEQASTEEKADTTEQATTEEAPKAEGTDKVETEEAPKAEETDKATEEAPKTEETDKATTEEAPAAEETSKAATEEAPKAEETSKAATEEAPKAEETEKTATEEAPKTEETDKVETEEAPKAEETSKAATEKAPKAEETNKVETEEAPAAEETNKAATEETPAVEDTNAKSNSNAQPSETERTQVVDTVAKDLYKKSEVTEAEKAEIEKVLPKDISNLSNEEIKKIALSEVLKETANKENAQPRATFRSVSSNARTTNVNYSATALRAAAQDTVTKKGTGNFTAHGDIIHKTYKEEFPNEGTLTAFNTNFNPNTGTKGALEYNDKIDFNKDFTITVPVANNNQGNTTGEQEQMAGASCLLKGMAKTS